MSRFIKTENDSYLNLDHVVEFRPDYHNSKDHIKGSKCFALGPHGQDLHHRCDRRNVDRLTFQTIPAYPGFTLLCVWFEEDRPWSIIREPIIGWRVDSDMSPDPIIADDPLGTDIQAILYPNGRIVVQYERWFDNEEDFVKYLSKTAEERRVKPKLVPA